MKKIIIVIPSAHGWFWPQTCIASMMRNPPKAEGYAVEIVVVNNAPWSPAIYGVRELATSAQAGIVRMMENYKANKYHASALDCIVESCSFDLLMTWETDVLALRSSWLQWFVGQLKTTDYAVGAWHHEAFLNPSCTLYRGTTLRQMAEWCRTEAPQDELRWGPNFEKTASLDDNLHNADNPKEILHDLKGWIGAPFAEKRGWPEGTVLKEKPSGQEKGPGHYEPGQALHHWAVQAGYTYTVCPTDTTRIYGVPVQTLYGSGFGSYRHALDPAELFRSGAETVHLWGGTRALDILKHAVHDQAIIDNAPAWLAREARFWKAIVPEDVRRRTLELIRQHGWHLTGQGNSVQGGDERDRAAAEYVKLCYEAGGVTW